LDFEGSSNLDLSQYFGDEGVLWWGVEMSKKSAGSSDKKKAAPAQSKGAPKPDKAQEPDDRQGDSSPSKTSEPPKKDEGKESGTEEQAILLVPADDEEGIDGIHTPAWILALPFVGLTHAAPANRDREKRSKRLAARTL
jgi:hypothetical protein